MGRRHRPASPHSFLAEGPRASRALSASRASSSLSSTGSSPAWPSPCRGRPSGRRGRTRRATMRACGLWPARQRAPSACPCAGADQHRPNRNTRQDAPPSPQASSTCNFWAVSQAESARNARGAGVSPDRRSRQRTTAAENRTEAQDPWRNRRPFPAKPSRSREDTPAGETAATASANAGAACIIVANTPSVT